MLINQCLAHPSLEKPPPAIVGKKCEDTQPDIMQRVSNFRTLNHQIPPLKEPRRRGSRENVIGIEDT